MRTSAPLSALLSAALVSLVVSSDWGLQARSQPAAPVQSTTPLRPDSPLTPGAPASGEAPGMSDKEKSVLQRIKGLKASRSRTYGPCRYDWATWKLMPDGVRTTTVQCGQGGASESVAVHCDTLKVSLKSGDQGWSAWRLPYAAEESSSRGGEDLMVAELCANVQASPKPTSPVTPTTTATPTTPAAPAKGAPPAKGTAPAKPPATGKSAAPASR